LQDNDSALRYYYTYSLLPVIIWTAFVFSIFSFFDGVFSSFCYLWLLVSATPTFRGKAEDPKYKKSILRFIFLYVDFIAEQIRIFAGKGKWQDRASRTIPLLMALLLLWFIGPKFSLLLCLITIILFEVYYHYRLRQAIENFVNSYKL